MSQGKSVSESRKETEQLFPHADQLFSYVTFTDRALIGTQYHNTKKYEKIKRPKKGIPLLFFDNKGYTAVDVRCAEYEVRESSSV